MSAPENNIGKNIREVRLHKGLSQEKLAKICDISNTVISAYENGRKTPGLDTVAVLAKQLGVNIERLYYGDENNAFINSEADEGKKIVNAVYFLWEQGIIGCYEQLFSNDTIGYNVTIQKPKRFFLVLYKYETSIKRLIKSLDEFKQTRHTYSNPDVYLESLKNSVAKEINIEISQNKEKNEKREKNKGVQNR